MPHIYLDHNATTPIAPEAAAAMAQCHAAGYANAASQHEPGRQARRVVEDAREAIGRLLGADVDSFQADRVIFTSGGTEANNLALFGLGDAGKGRLLVSAIEHPSVAGAAEHLEKTGTRVSRLGVTRDGVVRVDQLPALLTPDTRLASVMAGNNETGVLQPIAEVAAVCRAAGVPLHTDAVQVIGKLAVDFRAWNVDAMTVSAHKFHGPSGIGALVVRHGVELGPQLHGGFQQAALRPGTEPVALVVGFRAALELWHRNQAAILAQLTSLRDRFERRLLAAAPELIVHGARAPRLPHTSNVSFPGVDRQALMMALDLAGVACSTGSACASGSSEPSPALVAMGLERELIQGALRFSFGRTNTVADVNEAASRILMVYKDLRRRNKPPKMAAGTRESGRAGV